MKALLAVFILSITATASQASVNLPLDESILSNEEMPFASRRGVGRFDTTLAMNVQYQPVKTVRAELSKILGYDLKFFTLWEPAGEAHVTVITPVEYFDIIKKYVSIDRIEAIAQEMKIQESDLTILGLGRGQAVLQGKPEETYFIMVHSENLLKIRKLIYSEYLRKGGPKSAWNPYEFYPHITVGYSLRDLHISDGVIKNVKNSLDQRFNLYLQR